MGRPKKPEPRDRQFNLSLTANELRSIEQRAEAVGMRPVHFGRALLLAADRQSAPKADSNNHALRLVHAQLIRLGNNLNQLLRHLHRTGDPLPCDLEPLLSDIRKLIARVAK